MKYSLLFEQTNKKSKKFIYLCSGNVDVYEDVMRRGLLFSPLTVT